MERGTGGEKDQNGGRLVRFNCSPSTLIDQKDQKRVAIKWKIGEKKKG